MSIIIGETPSTGNDYKETAKDLCRALLEDERLKGVFSSIDAFMENDASKELFSQMQAKGEELQTKQQAGIELTAGEVEEYNKLREQMLEDPAAKAFVEAQESIQSVHQTIGSWVDEGKGL